MRERKSGRDGELKGERKNLREKDGEYENLMCKLKWMKERARSNIDGMELQIQLCVRWTLPSSKLLLRTLTCIILLGSC